MVLDLGGAPGHAVRPLLDYACAMPPLAARIAALLLASAVVAVGAPAALGASPRIVGGSLVDAPSSAPSTAFVFIDSASEIGLCSGSIIDATHILTAAHCAVDEQGHPWAPSDMLVEVGTSTASREDEGLTGPVLQIRVHPAYDPETDRADVAVLQVPPMPLSNTISPAPLVQAGATSPIGAQVRVFGWGDSGPDGAFDGNERMLDLTLDAPNECVWGVPAVGCAHSDAGSTCEGDSGGPVLRDGVQIGVIDLGIGSTDCAAGSVLAFADLSAPGIAEFVRGSDSPPAMPFASAPAKLVPPPLKGGAATCIASSWSNATTTTTVFFHRDGGKVVQQGKADTYLPAPSDTGHVLGCRSVASSPGGTAIVPAAQSFKVLAPHLAVRARNGLAVVSYSGAGDLPLTATLTSPKRRHAVWTNRLGHRRRFKLPSVGHGVYRLCVDAPPAGQFAGDQACVRWRATGRGS